MKVRPFVVLLLVSAGCKMGPDYQRPDLGAPEGWREVTPGEQQSLANKNWWELFDDPELVKLIEIALAENQDLKIAVERIEEARAIYGFTRADLYPKLDAYAAAGALEASRNGLPGIPNSVDNKSDLYQLGGQMFWELDFFGRIRRASEAELAQMYATEQARRAVVLTLVTDVARAYVELRDFDRRLDISRRTVESRVQYVALARDRFEGGVTSELDLRQAEAELHRTESLVFNFEQLVRQKENEISVLLGRNPGEIPRGRRLDEMVVPAEVPPGLPSELLERRPDLRQAEEQLVSANARIGSAKALLYPSISLTGSFGWESKELDELFDSPSLTWSLGANLLQPIFNAGQLQRGVEATEARQRQALYAYERSVRQAFREVEDSLIGVRQSDLRRTAEGQRVEAERKVVELSELRYRGGVSAYLQVLDAQRNLFNAELDETSAMRDKVVALIQLYKALGGGWVQKDDVETGELAEVPEGGAR